MDFDVKICDWEADNWPCLAPEIECARCRLRDNLALGGPAPAARPRLLGALRAAAGVAFVLFCQGVRARSRLSLCAAAHPLCTRSTTIFGVSTSEATTRPDPTGRCVAALYCPLDELVKSERRAPTGGSAAIPHRPSPRAPVIKESGVRMVE